MEIDYHTTLLNDMPNEVLSKKVDLAISVMPLEHPNIVSRPFASGRMVCAFPVGHPMAEREAVDLADLVSLPLILHSPQIAFGKMVQATLDRLGLHAARKVTELQTDVACSLVEARIGAAIIDQFTAAVGRWPGVVFRPLVQEMALTPCIAHSVFETPNRYAQRFIRILADTAAH